MMENCRVHLRSGMRAAKLTLAVAITLFGCKEPQRVSQELATPVTDAAATRDAAPIDAPEFALPDRPPVEYVLVVGSERHDVGTEPVLLADGRRVRVERTQRWTYAGREFSLEYAPSLRVIKTAKGVKLTSPDVSVDLALVSSDLDQSSALAYMVEAMEQASVVRSREDLTYAMFDHELPGVRLRTDGPVVEMFAAPIDRRRQFRIVVTATSSSSSLTLFREAIASVHRDRRAPLPQFVVTVEDNAGTRLGQASARTGQALTVAGTRMTIATRKTVSQQFRNLRFEHSPELAVRASAGPPPGVGVYVDSISIFAIELPEKVEWSELASSLHVPLRYPGPAQLSTGSNLYVGVVGQVSTGAIWHQAKLVSVDRDGRHFAVAILAQPEDFDRAERLAATIADTLH